MSARDKAPGVTTVMRVSDVLQDSRHRKDNGDLSSLAESIDTLGLLHPIVVTPDRRLVAGQRRLAACSSLGWTEVPVRVVEGLESALALLEAERDENTCRLDMKPSEKASLGMALEPLERTRAAERVGGRPPKTEENFSPVSPGPTGKTADIVGAAGMSRPTYQRAKLVVEAARDESLPDEVRAVAITALEEMDRTGKVLPAHDRVAALVGKKPARGGAKRDGRGHRKDKAKPYSPVTDRQLELARAQRRRLVAALSKVAGFCMGLDEVDMGMALSVMDNEERDGLSEQVAESIRQLRRMVAILKPGNE
jgi:ParB family chromosome partitioning protein